MSSNHQAALLEKIAQKKAVIGVVGLGYVGLPLVLRYVECGFPVIGYDIDSSKVDALNRGDTYIKHIGEQRVKDAAEKGMQATTDFSRIAEADAVILCVPTPLGQHNEPDMSYVISTTDAICPYLRAGQIVSLESTTYPGTTEEELLPRIEAAGHTVGENIFLVYSPEREDPGNTQFETRTIPKVLGGHTEHCLEAGKALYESAVDQVVPVSSTRAAELTKLLENIHRAVNIGLVNEMKIVADRMGIDIFEVIAAAATKPFGFTPYYPGPGLGGHCIPIDPFYLTWKAKEYGVNTRFIELAGEVNSAMPHYVVQKTMDALNDHGKALSTSKILVLGIAYKKNVDDMRESPSVEIMELLQDKGATITYSDPHVPVFPKMRRYHFELSSIALSNDVIADYDAIVLATDHAAFDYEAIAQYAQLVIDTRGKFAAADNIVKA